MSSLWSPHDVVVFLERKKTHENHRFDIMPGRTVRAKLEN